MINLCANYSRSGYLGARPGAFYRQQALVEFVRNSGHKVVDRVNADFGKDFFTAWAEAIQVADSAVANTAQQY